MATEFRILGELQVLRDGHTVDLGSHRPRTLLARLLIADDTVSNDRLLEDLWPGATPALNRHALHVCVSRLRRMLGDDGARLLRQGAGYLLVVETEELDAARFEQLARVGREAWTQRNAEAAGARLHEALELWRGPAFADLADEPFVREEADRLEELRLNTLLDRVWADLELGLDSELVDELGQLVSRHPYREDLAEQLMLALYRSGRQADALRVYQSTRTRLSEELGIDPGPALQRMEEHILRQDTSLELEGGVLAADAQGGLPPQRTSFLGRERELAMGAELLARSRLLTLTGAPGTGKTRLALRLAAAREAESGERAVFVSLAAVKEPGLVMSAIASTLGLRETGGEMPHDVVRAYLHDRRLLLLVDNFEHVLAAATQIGELLDEAPEVRVLVTSRSPLGLIGEQEFPVPPMAVPPMDPGLDIHVLRSFDAVALFGVRARAKDPEFGIDERNREDVAAIVTRLDGLPLAIELAAARVRVLAPGDLLARLDHRLSLLTGGPADDDERHHTMRTSIAWSYELLSPDEQALFRRLGVFRGGLAIDAAVAVAEQSDVDVVGGLDTLLSQSLLVRLTGPGPARFSMLEMMREFALDQLAAKAEAGRAADLHAGYFSGLAAEVEPLLTGDDPAVAVGRLRTENDNLRGALRHALGTGDPDLGLELAHAIWRFWQSTGQLGEGRYWLEELLSMEGATETSRARGYTALAGLAYWQGDFLRSRSEYEHALALYRATSDRSGEADTLYGMSLATVNTDTPETAAQLAREAKSIYLELGAEAQVGEVLMAEASAAWRHGDLDGARTLWEEALRIHRELDDRNLVASELVGLAAIVFLQGDADKAIHDVSTALDMSIKTGNAHMQLFALDTLASLMAGSRTAEAVRLAGAVKVMRETHGGGWTLEEFGIANARTTAEGLLAEDEIERAWAEGSEMDLGEAVALGRELLA